MRPIYWGVIWFFIGIIGWIAFSVVYGVIGGLSGHVPLEGWFFVYLFGLIFFFSLPVAIVAEIVSRYRRRKRIKAPEAEPSRLGPARPVVYCREYGRQMPSGSLYCDQCGTRL